MHALWKFNLTTKKFQEISMPKGAQILNGMVKNELAVIWAMVYQTDEMETRRFELTATGHPLKACKNKFVCSFHFEGGKNVQHLYEISGSTVNEIKDDCANLNKSLPRNKNSIMASGLRQKLLVKVNGLKKTHNQLINKLKEPGRKFNPDKEINHFLKLIRKRNYLS